jgi:hypothetical protein
MTSETRHYLQKQSTSVGRKGFLFVPSPTPFIAQNPAFLLPDAIGVLSPLPKNSRDQTLRKFMQNSDAFKSACHACHFLAGFAGSGHRKSLKLRILITLTFLAKVEVAGSNPVSRSFNSTTCPNQFSRLYRNCPVKLVDFNDKHHQRPRLPFISGP